MSVLRLDNVVKEYDDHIVLDGVSLTVNEGEVVALIGASGSGKSTLLKTINLLERVSDGQIFLRDTDITDPRVNEDQIRARMGVVFQQYNLFPHLSVVQNITLALRHVHGVPRADAVVRATELLTRVGLADKANAHPDRLSGGQQQRVALARAVASRPEVLLLDEITAALDPTLVGEVLDLVRDLAADGITIVMATHEMAFARDVADRVIFLADGVIVESGTPTELFGNPQDSRTQAFLARATH